MYKPNLPKSYQQATIPLKTVGNAYKKSKKKEKTTTRGRDKGWQCQELKKLVMELRAEVVQLKGQRPSRRQSSRLTMEEGGHAPEGKESAQESH